MHKEALILAGGKGTRAGGSFPKQFQLLCGRPLLWWSLRAFKEYDPEIGITIVVHPEYANLWMNLFNGLRPEERFNHRIAFGGAERSESVRNGLLSLKIEPKDGDNDILVAIHDGARPLITVDMIARGYDMAADKGNAIPVVPVTDSLRELAVKGEMENGSCPVDRNRFVAVQTPQIFSYRRLTEAYRLATGLTFTDDASLVESLLGDPIHLYPGHPSNIKVTNPGDFLVAEALLQSAHC